MIIILVFISEFYFEMLKVTKFHEDFVKNNALGKKKLPIVTLLN